MIDSFKVECYDKAIECLDDDGERRVLWGKKKPILVGMVTTIQAKHNYRKGCLLFAMHISSEKGKEVEDAIFLSEYPVLL